METFTAIGRFLYDLTLEYGVIGLAGGAFLESLGIPTASAVIDLTAGVLIINKRTTFLEALIVSDMGLTAGSLVSFYLGRLGSRVTKRSIARNWIEKYGDKAVLFGVAAPLGGGYFPDFLACIENAPVTSGRPDAFGPD